MSLKASCATGLHVLVVEDEFIVSMLVEDILLAEGCVIIGPCSRLHEALAVARSAHIDLAILDVNLAGEKVFEVAQILEMRRIPFIFVTGYGDSVLPADHPEWLALSKPYTSEALVKALITQTSTIRKV